jgi:hypothetical protein
MPRLRAGTLLLPHPVADLAGIAQDGVMLSLRAATRASALGDLLLLPSVLTGCRHLFGRSQTPPFLSSVKCSARVMPQWRRKRDCRRAPVLGRSKHRRKAHKTQGLPKGYPLATQGLPKGPTRSQYQRNPGAILEQRVHTTLPLRLDQGPHTYPGGQALGQLTTGSVCRAVDSLAKRST